MTPPPFRHTFTVRLHDIDAAGILFYGHLFRHAHDAYEAFMTIIGLPLHRLIQDGDCRLPLVHAEADYRQPLRHGEVIQVELDVQQIGRSAFTLDYRFVDEVGREKARARTVHVHLGPAGASAPLPVALVAALRPWISRSELDD
ncbi:MAG: acyl-CoA thioesterase [Gammaproteobacteria bacterium]|jgi:1,4-dihydroxy-2-naphthoyl-CoA hydrolase|nr:acyl-CoA thioesterase [Gammaproteobacteria bacterium]